MRDPNDTRDTGPRAGSPLWIHMTAVIVVGAAVFAWGMTRLSGLEELLRHPQFWVIAALVVVGEMRPIVTPGRSGLESPVASLTFGLAALLYWGFPVAVLLRAASSLAVGLAQRKAPHRCAFNAAQTTLSTAAAALALALTGISPGDVALLDLAIGGGVKLSTGVFVLYADAESFTLMTPQGHMFAGWITFSAERAGDTTTVQAQVLMRANDPLYEIGMTLGGHRKEDKFWVATLTALGQRLGVPDPKVETRSICVDSKRQWRHSSNVWHNSMVRSVLQTLAAPVTALRRRG